MPQVTTLTFTDSTLQTLSQASVMRGIGLKRLAQKDEVFRAFLTATLFFVSEAGKKTHLSQSEFLAALEMFLYKEAPWLQATPDELLDELSETGCVACDADAVHFSLDIAAGWDCEAARQFLKQKEFEKKVQRERIRARLQEKNRAVNAAHAAQMDPSLDCRMMHIAITEAKKALKAGEVPVGAVLVLDGEILAQAGNSVIGTHDPTAHAEISVIRAACQKRRSERLTGATLYVTLEPCPMCAAALALARIRRVVWGADDPKAGALSGALTLQDFADLNHKVSFTGGVLKEECALLLTDFFTARRRDREPGA